MIKQRLSNPIGSIVLLPRAIDFLKRCRKYRFYAKFYVAGPVNVLLTLTLSLTLTPNNTMLANLDSIASSSLFIRTDVLHMLQLDK